MEQIIYDMSPLIPNSKSLRVLKPKNNILDF